MGQIEFVHVSLNHLVDPSVDARDDVEPAVHRVPGIPESARYGWESAWIDIGGEG